MDFYCKCEDNTMSCVEGRCPTFSIERILDNIQSIEFAVLGTWNYKTLDSLSEDLYQRSSNTISEFYQTLNYYIESDYDTLRCRVLYEKFNYIQAKMTCILKNKIGYEDKNEAIIKIENLEYKIDFKTRTISHTTKKGCKYYTNYGEHVKDLEYFFLEDPMIHIEHGMSINIIHIFHKDRNINPFCSFYLNGKYIDEESSLNFSRLEYILVYDFGDSSDEEY